MKAHPQIKTLPVRVTSRRGLKDGVSFQYCEKNFGENQARIMRALGRLGCWQCVACGEIYPAAKAIDDDNVFGACKECWLNHESLEERIDFDKLSNWNIKQFYQRWNKNVFDAIGPFSWAARNNTSPWEFDYLAVLFGYVGKDLIAKALKELCPGPRPRILDVDHLTWRGEWGLCPRMINLPAKDDRNGWSKVKDDECLLEII
jgi:hypothetical protein